jgi:two-component system, sensor histidine kinase and response regulator
MTETLNILIVDDEPGMQTGTVRALERYRPKIDNPECELAFDVHAVESAEAGLEWIDSHPVDILLLDYKLPGMSGLDLLDKLQQRDGGDTERLTIMITAYASLETAVTATKRGAYDFLAKPFTPQELKAMVRKASGRLMLARTAHRLAEEKRRVRFEFIRVLTHELKAPLGAVEGYLHLLRDGSLEDDQAAKDKVVDRCIVRMSGLRKLIVDTLDMTRIESGEKRRELIDVDIVEVAEMVVETFQQQAVERGITVNLHADGAMAMKADRGELEIILNNLVSNSIKYNRDNGTVDVTILGDDENITLTIADSGIGMTAEEAENLFSDFVRIKNAKTRNIDGSGLGLSIIEKLAQLYDGDATVASEPDVGSTFTVVLARNAEPEE